MENNLTLTSYDLWLEGMTGLSQTINMKTSEKIIGATEDRGIVKLFTAQDIMGNQYFDREFIVLIPGNTFGHPSKSYTPIYSGFMSTTKEPFMVFEMTTVEVPADSFGSAG